MKEKIKLFGMDLALRMFDFIDFLKGLLGEFTCKDMGMNPDGETFISLNPPTSFRWKIFCFLDNCETISSHIFNFFFYGSEAEKSDAMNLEYGDAIELYNSNQQNLIKLHGLL